MPSMIARPQDRSWSATTGGTAPGARRAAWAAALGSFTQVADLAVDDDDHFSANLTARRLSEDLLLVRLAADPNHLVHRLVAPPRPGSRALFAMAFRTGSGAAAQNGRWVDFGPGDVVFRASDSQTELRLTTPTSGLGIMLSEDRLARAGLFWPPDQRHPFKAPAAHPIVPGIGGLCTGLGDELTSFPAAMASSIENAIIQLILAWADSNSLLISAKARQQEDRWNGIARRIEAMLATPDLRLDHVARASKCSRRTIQKVFAERGTTFERYLMRRRLDSAEAALARVGRGGVRIIDVAFSCGFNDLGHFSRRFKQQFGRTPTEHCELLRASQ